MFKSTHPDRTSRFPAAPKFYYTKTARRPAAVPARPTNARGSRVPHGRCLRGSHGRRRSGNSPRGPREDRFVQPRRLQPAPLSLPAVALGDPPLPPPLPPQRRLAHLLPHLRILVLPVIRAPAPPSRPRHVTVSSRRRPALLSPPHHAAVRRPPRARPRIQALSLSSSSFSASCLITLYSRSRSPVAARNLFDEIPVAIRDTVCYSSTIVGLAQNDRYEESLFVFSDMRSNAVDSTLYALSGVLRAAAGLAALEQTLGIHAHAVVVGLDGNVVVGTALVDAYGKAGLVDDAGKMLVGLSGNRNLITWNAVLAAHAQQGEVQAVARLFRQMVEMGFTPDKLTFLAVLTACSNAGAAAEAEFWLGEMKSKYNLKPGLEHYTSVVGAMARMGRLDDAKSVACTMPCKPDAAVWRTLLMGCVVHRKVDMAEAMGQRLF
jgi:pentatricopeptide repeat protein